MKNGGGLSNDQRNNDKRRLRQLNSGYLRALP